MSKISRRDFIKLGSLSAVSALLPQWTQRVLDAQAARPNIIIILFDAMSARNLSLYGYKRSTTPNFIKFAKGATVFHQHYSGGNFTTPGTASMLTGMYPWTHRAFNQGGLIKREYHSDNPYTLLGKDYFRFAFSQNPWPDRLVSQFYDDVDRILPPTSFSLRSDSLVMDKLGRDRSLASLAIEEFLFSTQADTVGSSLLGYIYRSFLFRKVVNEQQAHSDYPRGVPEVEGYVTPYLNEEVYKGVAQEILKLAAQETPFFAYFHLFSPHSPYKPRRNFRKLFNDNFRPVEKPVHPLGPSESEERLLAKRTTYDQQVAQVDFEFGNLITDLDAHGVLDNSYVIATSDHGEMFERGFDGHGGLLMYEPNIRIPLMIHAPGQSSQVDVQQYTSNVDVLPSLLSLAGKPIPQELDGRVLPEFGGSVDPNRPIFSMFSVENPAFSPIQKAAISMRRGDRKLIAYLGYEHFDGVFELYDLANDPEELTDLAGKDKSALNSMKEEFLQHLSQANLPYTRK